MRNSSSMTFLPPLPFRPAFVAAGCLPLPPLALALPDDGDGVLLAASAAGASLVSRAGARSTCADVPLEDALVSLEGAGAAFFAPGFCGAGLVDDAAGGACAYTGCEASTLHRSPHAAK